MKIAVVTPKNINGERGGAENLYEGLVGALNDRGHHAVQIEVLVDESSFEGILEAYCNCFYLNLDDYDLVISTKAPTYMVRHRNHISYLLHTIRVFYDMFDKEFDIKDKERQKQRRLIHEFDKYGLNTQRVNNHFVNGSAVYKRMRDIDEYWERIDFQALHHPPKIENFKEPGEGEIIFLPGRLHRWKRTDLIIESMKYVKHDVDLMISGSGEDEGYYRELAKNDSRIKFLGWIDDDTIVDLYSRAIVVPFVPIDEDYGLVTVEAFKSKKPVITCLDSGEPSLIVEDGISGFVVDPDPKKIAEKINYLIENPDKAERMGENGYHSVESITWDNVVGVILHNHNSELEHKRENPRIKVLVTDNQVLDPPIGGGRVRIYQLYKNFNKNFYDITYFGTFDWLGPLEREQKLAENFAELLVPMTVPHLTIDRIFSKLSRNVITLDVTTPFLMRFTPKYKIYLSRLITDTDVLIVSHPWVYPSVKSLIAELNMKPLLIYDSHNFEYKIKKGLLPNTITGRILVKNVQRIEKMLANECDLIFACSDEDAQCFSKFYKISHDKILVIPNGASIQNIDLPTEEEKKISKKRFGFTNKQVAVFLASGGYKPNDDAAKYICLKLAPLLDDIDFVLIGSVCDIISKKYKVKLKNNIKLMGVVSEEEKIDLLYASDIALNPVMEGSGTNIKIFDYMAAGLPLLTTPIGARGIEFKDYEDAIIAGLEEFPEILTKLSEDSKLRNRLSKGARDLAERYDWKEIAEIAQNGILNMSM
jgi:glycosyltransferase involved in cell wall biosynthesis